MKLAGKSQLLEAALESSFPDSGPHGGRRTEESKVPVATVVKMVGGHLANLKLVDGNRGQVQQLDVAETEYAGHSTRLNFSNDPAHFRLDRTGFVVGNDVGDEIRIRLTEEG